MNRPDIARRLLNLMPIIVVCLFVIGYMISGYMTLSDDPRRVPILTGYVTLLLIMFDLVRSWLLPLAVSETPADGSAIPLTRELQALLYLGGFVFAVYLVGFLVVTPFYLFTSIAYLGQQSTRLALYITIPASLVIYLVFELLLENELFRGVLLS